jgi:hypothetical protein
MYVVPHRNRVACNPSQFAYPRGEAIGVVQPRTTSLVKYPVLLETLGCPENDPLWTVSSLPISRHVLPLSLSDFPFVGFTLSSRSSLRVRPVGVYNSLPHLRTSMITHRSMYSLPPEVWRIIFRFATDVPGIFDTSFLPALQNSPRSWSEVNDATSFRTKFALVRVSRLWNQMSLPLLYEYVFIRNANVLDAFATRLQNRNNEEDYVARAATLAHQLRYTKRLEMPAYLDRQEAFGREMTIILSSCPNLVVLHMDENTLFLPPILPSLQKTCRGVKHLRWRFRGPGDALLRVIPSFDALEVLDIVDRVFWVDPKTHRAAPITLMKLHTVIIQYDDGCVVMDALSLWKLPRLTRVALSSVDFGQTPYKFFEAFGPQLTQVDVSHSDPEMPYLLGKCTNLVKLSINSRTFYEGLDRPHPTLSHVIVTCGSYSTIIPDDSTTDFLECMWALYAMRGPSLKSIQVIAFDDEPFGLLLDKQSRLALIQEWTEIWEREKVRFGSLRAWAHYLSGGV